MPINKRNRSLGNQFLPQQNQFLQPWQNGGSKHTSRLGRGLQRFMPMLGDQIFNTMGGPTGQPPLQGLSNQRFPAQELPHQNFPAQGLPSQGFPAQGSVPQTFPAQGLPHQGFPPQECGLQGQRVTPPCGKPKQSGIMEFISNLFRR